MQQRSRRPSETMQFTDNMDCHKVHYSTPDTMYLYRQINMSTISMHSWQTCQLSRILCETYAFAMVPTSITHTSSSPTQKRLLSGCSYHTLHVCIRATHDDITVTCETCTTAAKPPKRTYRDASDRKHLEHGPLLPQQR